MLSPLVSVEISDPGRSSSSRDGNPATADGTGESRGSESPMSFGVGGYQCLTQNVRGLAKAGDRPTDWFSGLRALQHGSHVDAVCLQETRATDAWAPKLADAHARAWGFEPAHLASPLSYWHPTPTAAGGVAILLHPQSRLRSLQPLWEDWWSAQFIALAGRVDGDDVVLMCLYAPINKKVREKLYRRLRQRRPPVRIIMVGGDFNCVLDEERDCSRHSTTNTDSPELRQLLQDWQLIDAISADLVQA